MLLAAGPGTGPLIDFGLHRPAPQGLRSDPLMTCHGDAGGRERRISTAMFTQQPQRSFLGIGSIRRGMLPSPLDSKETGTKPEVIRAVPHGTRGWSSRKQLVVKSSGTAVCDIAPTRSFTAHGPASSANF